jgi:N-acylglucosamine-6-phosphate 2-epimerase
MTMMAAAAAAGGAVGFRVQGAADIAAVRALSQLPIIGLKKVVAPDDGSVFITPSFDDAAEIAAAGADIIALDGTARPRPGGESLPQIVHRIHEELGLPVMADIDCLDSALFALESGVDAVGTTLAGYTGGGSTPDTPDIELISLLVEHLDTIVIAEGRIWSREDVAAAYAAGAFSVVVGTAITNPMLITQRMVAATPSQTM